MSVKNGSTLIAAKLSKLALFIFLIILTGRSEISAQQYSFNFKHLTVDEGLSHTDANDIAQDSKGYIWIATYFGLDRFDGYSVKKYYNSNHPIKNAYKNRIRFVYPDSDGNIWLGTEDGLQYFDPRKERYHDLMEITGRMSPYIGKMVKPSGNRIYGLIDGYLKTYILRDSLLIPLKVEQPKETRFSDIFLDSKGIIYLSSNKGIWMIDKTNHLKPVKINGLNGQGLSWVYIDKEKNLITADLNKIYLIPGQTDKELTVTRQFSHPAIKRIKNIFQDQNRGYWLNTGKELIRLDGNMDFIQVVNNKNTQSLISDSFTKLMIDRSGCLWLGTFGNGVSYCDLNEKLFYTLKNEPRSPNSLSGNFVRSIFSEGDYLWIGTGGNGLNRYDFKSKNFTFYNTYSSAVRLKNDVVTALTKDNVGNLWIGTNSGIEILAPNRTSFYKPKGYDKFPSYVIETLVKDYYGNIWFGNHTQKFGVIYRDGGDSFKVRYYGEGYFFFADQNKPQLFVSSTNGLKRMYIDRQGNIIKTFEYRGSEKKNSLSSDYTYPIGKQNDNTYWIGTIGGGLNRLDLKKDNSYSIKIYNEKSGVFNDVESLEIDGDGNIWMGGNGLECLDPKTGKLTRYDKNDGLQGNSFKVGSSFKGEDGRLYFGGINGLNYFYPRDIKPNTIKASPILTDVLINNLKPDYNDHNSAAHLSSDAIGYGSQIRIDYKQNNFIIFFSAMHFANPLKCSYRYKLIGFDSDWKYTDGKNPSAAYSNLDFKTYKFILQATNNDGAWSDITAETSILISPPWWKSTVAKSFYIIIILAGLAAIYISQARWYRLKREIAIREINENRRAEMHRHKEELSEQQLMFFTNISHEFRTPLTLILGPLETLIKQNLNEMLEHPYQLMYRNAKRLLNLISEIMNFRKVADQIIKLQVQEVAINDFVNGLAQEFNEPAGKKNITFITRHSSAKTGTEVLKGFLDIQIVEKILFNLLNNSFKYTAENGGILFETFTDLNTFEPSYESGFELINESYAGKDHIYFRINDSGIGISKESIHKIFDRYYRISTEHLGSGIGLALVKSLTELHKGDIYVYSERNRGTEILIGIPVSKMNYSGNEILSSHNITEFKLEPIDHSIFVPPAKKANDGLSSNEKSGKRILIVEDNDELLDYLKSTLGHSYQIYQAGNGNDGLRLAIEHIPDLIISDVMMPGMNGIEFCRLIKEKFETSHIPFIILSAKDALDAKIAGMESGADFYFAKPLSAELLLLTIHNLFEQSERLKDKYAKNYLSEATELVKSDKDKEFVSRLLDVIENNIKDPDLDVDFLCNSLFISRTKLYQKIKSISNQSVGDFIRTTRLKKAIKIMTHEDVPLYEVAERTGLQSSSTFSRAFKKEFGKSPLHYIQDLRKNNLP
jgi:signal transduction histidine kinase/ligand-binding sensor domain-containing protein/DNA-binding NarL/FixJ family response regulator